MPGMAMDLGACQIQGSQEIMVFGGFKDTEMCKSVWFYNASEGQEGAFKKEMKELQRGDFFQVNGVYV